MDQRIFVRYSMSFKQQVVEELESGRFSSILKALIAYLKIAILKNKANSGVSSTSRLAG